MSNLEGRELGSCKLIRKLGVGGMGEVYLAEQRNLGNRLVAVKVVSPDDATFHPEVAEDLARRFQREAALLGQLSHPNILPVHDSGVEGSLLYLVMEYAPEGSLLDAIHGNAKNTLDLPLDLPFAIHIISQIAAALEYTHEHNIVHRDVKPANVLVRIEPNGDWHMLLADFGVARGLENTSQRTQITGTFAYMAPEQFSGKFSPASDQYALAVMAFQLLAGHTPFEGDLATLTRAHMYEPPPSLHALNPDVPQALDAVLQRALAKDPAERYPSVAAFTAALRAAAGVPEDVAAVATAHAGRPSQPAARKSTPAPVVATPPLDPAATMSTTRHAQRKRQPWRIVLTLLAAALLLIGVLGGTAFIAAQQMTPNGQATKTPRGSQTTTTTPGSTVTAGTAVVSVTALPTCAPDATAPCAPPPPVAVGAPVLVAPTPPCDGTTYGWQPSLDVTKTCSTSSGLALKATKANILGCLSATTEPTSNGYASIQVTPKSGPVVLAFRQSPGSSSSTYNVTGYYFTLIPDASGSYMTYSLYRIDTTGQSTTILNSLTTPFTPGKTFVMGVEYQGSQITPYLGTQTSMTALQPASDSTFTQGWFGMCTGGTATFQNAEVYALAS